MTRIICSWRDPIPTLIIPPLYPIFRHSNRRVRCLLVLHSSLSHSFLLFLSLVLFHSLSLVHMNTSKHTDLRKIFFSFSLESGIQFCAIIGTPYWISPLPIKRHRGTIFFCNVRGRPLGNEGHTIAISRVKFTERYFAIQWKGIQSVRRERERERRVFLSPSCLFPLPIIVSVGRIPRREAVHARIRIENFATNRHRELYVELYWPDGASLSLLPTETFFS